MSGKRTRARKAGARAALEGADPQEFRALWIEAMEEDPAIAWEVLRHRFEAVWRSLSLEDLEWGCRRMRQHTSFPGALRTAVPFLLRLRECLSREGTRFALGFRQMRRLDEHRAAYLLLLARPAQLASLRPQDFARLLSSEQAEVRETALRALGRRGEREARPPRPGSRGRGLFSRPASSG